MFRAVYIYLVFSTDMLSSAQNVMFWVNTSGFLVKLNNLIWFRKTHEAEDAPSESRVWYYYFVTLWY